METVCYEVKYCPKQKGNVGIQVIRGEEPVPRRRCLCGENCPEECPICQGEGLSLWK